MYDVINRAHISTGHGRRDKMLKVLSTKYANVTIEAIELYKSLCVECLKKRKRRTVKGVVVRPILSIQGTTAHVDRLILLTCSRCQMVTTSGLWFIKIT